IDVGSCKSLLQRRSQSFDRTRRVVCICRDDSHGVNEVDVGRINRASAADKVLCLSAVALLGMIEGHMAEGACVAWIHLQLFVGEANRLVVSGVGFIFVSGPSVGVG